MSDTPHPTTAPDRTPPSIERQAELRAAYEANVAAGNPPYKNIEITDRDELDWIFAERSWSGTIATQGKMEHPDLRNISLFTVDLTGIELNGANLNGANLTGAILIGAFLINANLVNANLTGIDLSDARLDRADLSNANLRGATLADASFASAELKGANFSATILNGTSFNAADLSGADLSGATLSDTTELGNTALFSPELGGIALGDIRWHDVDLTNTDWSTLPRLGDERHFDPHIKTSARDISRAYRQLATQLRAQGIAEDADRFAYRAQFWQRRALRQQRRYFPYLGSLLLDLISGYGYKPARSFATYLIVILSFALLYFGLGNNVTPALNPVDAVIFSITSFHGRGFSPGEFVALHNPLTIAAATEAIIGLLIEITFIATFTQRFFAK